MRLLMALMLVAASPAAANAQTASSAVLDALQDRFPDEYSALARSLAGASPDSAGTLTDQALARFQVARLEPILAAPGARLIAIEAHHSALLRSLQALDVRHCALVGDRGFFSAEALSGPRPAGLEAYAVSLIDAAAAGRDGTAPEPPTAADFQAWLAEVERLEPNVPVRAMLLDRARRAAAGAGELCAGALAMHEAVASLPPEPAARMAGLLIRSTLAAGGAAD